MPGDHLSVLLPPHVAVLAAQLRGALERAEEALPPRPELAASEGLRSLAEAP